MKKMVWYSFISILVLGSCIPATATPRSIPFDVPTLTLTPVSPTQTEMVISTQVPVTDTPAPAQLMGTETSTPSLSEAYLSEIHMMDETEGWAWAVVDSKGAFFLLHTSDGGLSWEDVTPNKNFGVPFYLDGKTVWLPVYDPSTYSNTGLLRTIDGGESWKFVNQTMGDIDISLYFYGFGFQDAMNGWWRAADVGAGTAHMRFYQTKDGGVTWEPAIINIPKELSDHYYIRSDYDNEIAVCNVCGSFFYFDLSRIMFSPGEWSPTVVWMTRDLGLSWQKIELPGLPENIDPDSSPVQYPTFFDEMNGILPVFIKDDGTDMAHIFIYATQDNGLTWSLENEPTIMDQFSRRGADIEFITRLDGFLTSQDGLSLTHDGGKTWISIAMPEEFKSSDSIYVEKQLNFIDPKTGWMVLKRRSMGTSKLLADILLKTTDGGMTWSEIVPVIQ